MSDILRERFYLKGHECGECGGWVSSHNPTPCNGAICGPDLVNEDLPDKQNPGNGKQIVSNQTHNKRK